MAGGQRTENGRKPQGRAPKGTIRKLTAVEDAHDLLRTGNVQGAISRLDRALELLMPQVKAAQAAAAEASLSAAVSHRPSLAMQEGEVSRRGSKVSPSRRNSATSMMSAETPVDEVSRQASTVIQCLCLCHARKSDWEAVCGQAAKVLGPDAIVLANRELRQDLQLRRAVALAHLARSSATACVTAIRARSKSPSKTSRAAPARVEGAKLSDALPEVLDPSILERAVADLEAANAKDSRNETVRRCYNAVCFMKAQARAGQAKQSSAVEEAAQAMLKVCTETSQLLEQLPEPDDDDQAAQEPPRPRELRGLERIRAMSP